MREVILIIHLWPIHSADFQGCFINNIDLNWQLMRVFFFFYIYHQRWQYKKDKNNIRTIEMPSVNNWLELWNKKHRLRFMHTFQFEVKTIFQHRKHKRRQITRKALYYCTSLFFVTTLFSFLQCIYV
jgi:hypothetical protein